MTRLELIDAAVARAAALLPGVSVERFDGDERTFNEDATFPHVAVGIARATGSENLEAGPDPSQDGALYARTWELELTLATADSDADTADGYAAGLGHLETLEAGLAGHVLSGQSQRLAWRAEEQTVAWLGRFEWTQRYQLQDLQSR